MTTYLLLQIDILRMMVRTRRYLKMCPLALGESTELSLMTLTDQNMFCSHLCLSPLTLCSQAIGLVLFFLCVLDLVYLYGPLSTVSYAHA